MSEQTVFKRPESLVDRPHHYCPGCGHGIIHSLVAQVIDELGIREKLIGIAPVGCAVLMYDYLNADMIQAPHGRAPALATGIKRARPDLITFTYQGDGDLAAIGTAEIIHAANRGENFNVIFVNNAIYGMTGGQMAPTTLIGQKTETTPDGRDSSRAGHPIKVCELLRELAGVTYLERVSVHDAKNMMKAKKAIKKSFENQINNKGFSLVEVLSMCPTNWGLSPVKAINWLQDNMLKEFPLGVFLDKA